MTFSQFNKFLVIKIADRVQQMAQEKCSGCTDFRRHDQLHECMQITLNEKFSLFLPKVKSEALERIDRLFDIFKLTNWIHDNRQYTIAGVEFIKQITATDLLDRRYVNEDTAEEHVLDMSWLADDHYLSEDTSQEISFLENTLPPILPLDLPATSVKNKSVKKKSTSSSVKSAKKQKTSQ